MSSYLHVVPVCDRRTDARTDGRCCLYPAERDNDVGCAKGWGFKLHSVGL